MFPFGCHYNPGVSTQKSHQHIMFSTEGHIFDEQYYPILELTTHCKHIDLPLRVIRWICIATCLA